MMMFATLIQLGFLAILGSAAPSPAPRGVSCALCPQADLAGEPIVASSGGTQGVPRFCGSVLSCMHVSVFMPFSGSKQTPQKTLLLLRSASMEYVATISFILIFDLTIIHSPVAA